MAEAQKLGQRTVNFEKSDQLQELQEINVTHLKRYGKI